MAITIEIVSYEIYDLEFFFIAFHMLRINSSQYFNNVLRDGAESNSRTIMGISLFLREPWFNLAQQSN